MTYKTQRRQNCSQFTTRLRWLNDDGSKPFERSALHQKPTFETIQRFSFISQLLRMFSKWRTTSLTKNCDLRQGVLSYTTK